MGVAPTISAGWREVDSSPHDSALLVVSMDLVAQADLINNLQEHSANRR